MTCACALPAGVTIAATGGNDRAVRLWGLAPLLPSPVQQPLIATLRGHGAPITCLALAGADPAGGDTANEGCSWDDGGRSGGGSGGSCLLSGSLDGKVKAFDAWAAACTGTIRCAAPVAAMQAAAANPLLQPHTVLAAGGSGVQLLDLRCMHAVGGVTLPLAEPVRYFSQWGQHLAVGSKAGASVFDLAMLPSQPVGGAGGARRLSGGGERLHLARSGGTVSACGACTACVLYGLLVLMTASRALPLLLLLLCPWLQVSSIHVDRHKVVTASHRYGASPLRVWCSDSGGLLASGGCSCTEPWESKVGSAAGGGSGTEDVSTADVGDEEREEEARCQLDDGGLQLGLGHAAWNPSREGVTALAVRGALLVAGSGAGTVCERDFGQGWRAEAKEGGLGEDGAQQQQHPLCQPISKFWEGAIK